MVKKSGISIFLLVALGIWTALNAYVFWRISTIPWMATHIPRFGLIFIAAFLWLSYPLARILNASNLSSPGIPLELIGANWIGVLFLLFCALAVTDIVTLGGYAFPDRAPEARGWAAGLATALSVIALVQGFRRPVLQKCELVLPGLPAGRDGLKLLAISDTHLGTILGKGWCARLIARAKALQPDAILIVGDLFDGHKPDLEKLLPTLKQFQAPMGVWAVTGNHEYYNGLDHSIELMQAAGCKVLRDRSESLAPGLIIAGVDDLTARKQFGGGDHAVERALANRPDGATILMSHSPWEADCAAACGVGLMLSGHTHNGQVWPFNYLVRSKYRYLKGIYDVSGMKLLVSRGAGTWGPRMRLWFPAEIHLITLRSPES